jgi:hypothetical protein
MSNIDVINHLRPEMPKISPALNVKKSKIGARVSADLKTQVQNWYKLHNDIIHRVSQAQILSPWDKLIAASTCKLKADVKPTQPQTSPCSLGVSGGYQGLENQLYRVEIHSGGTITDKPTFKWSRDNGSIIFPFEILSADDNQTIVGLTTQDLGSYYPVSKEAWIGAWVEIINDEIELNGESGPLLQVIDVPSESQMTLAGMLDTTVWADKGKHPILRRWDQQSDALINGARPVTEGEWIDLESGIQIWFEKNGTYKIGDYWLIPARTETGDVEWPRSNGEPIAKPPLGIRHHYARLAVLTAAAAGKDKTIVTDNNTTMIPGSNKTIITDFHDCEPVFSPLAAHALHVVGMNWCNDSTYHSDATFKAHFQQTGLQITLDDAPDVWTINPSSLIVTLEMPTGQSLTLPGEISAQNNVITWRIQTKQSKDSTTHLKEIPDFSLVAMPNYLYRVRITLKGELIWRTCCDQRFYLDGQAFGRLRNENTDAGVSIKKYDLILPTGAGARASDFESWFYMVIP